MMSSFCADHVTELGVAGLANLMQPVGRLLLALYYMQAQRTGSQPNNTYRLY